MENANVNVHRISRFSCAGVAILLVCAATNAQSPNCRSETVKIVLTGSCRSVPDEIRVVYNGRDDDLSFIATRDGGCTWTGTAPQPFCAARARFSLRLGIARTDCHTAENPNGFVPQLQFACCPPRPNVQVTVSTTGSVPVGYLRSVPRTPNQRRSVACIEHGFFDEGSGTIEDVQFSGEALRLQLAVEQVTLDAPGLLLYPAIIRDPGKSDRKTLTLGTVLDILAAERNGGKLSAMQNQSGNARDIDDAELRAAGLLQLRIEVAVK